MSRQTVDGFECGKWQGKSIEIEAVEENLTSDGGLMPMTMFLPPRIWVQVIAGPPPQIVAVAGCNGIHAEVIARDGCTVV